MTVPGAPASAAAAAASSSSSIKPKLLSGNRRPWWKQIPLLPPEIPATRFSCLTSGSLRPKLGLALLAAALTLLLCLVLAPLLAAKMSKPEIQKPEAVAAVAKSNLASLAKLYPALVAAKGPEANLAFSPFSLSSVVAMLYAGAGGETAQQIRETLSLDSNEDAVLEGFEDFFRVTRSSDTFSLEAANKLYVQNSYPVLQEYLTKAEKHFKASAENVDFAKEQEVRELINSWVATNTNSKIKDLIPKGALTALTRLVLVNAVYFKGSWASKFDAKQTQSDADFHVSPSKTVKVEMMHRHADYVAAKNNDLGCLILQLPYAGDRLSMLLFLPHKAEGFADLEKKFAEFDFSSFPPENIRKTKFDVRIPRFKLETTLDLNEPMKAAGMRNMFTEGAADFGKLTADAKDLHVSNVLQKTFVEVNEEGTEAAAATGAIMMTRMAVIPQNFHCDRPFLFAIKDELTGVVLFAGRVVNPTEQ